MTKIILGTANFGNEYGVANGSKVLSRGEVKTIINWAQANGINHFDTAFAYGDSTDLLSTYLDKSAAPIIDTKLDEKSCQSSKLIVENALISRNKLGIEQLSVLYLHNESLIQASWSSEISKGLKEVLNLGIAKKIGVSVYSEEAIFTCKKILPELSVFQVPENICDRRLLSSSKIQKLSEEGNDFMIRSIFLQGLLLMKPNVMPEELKSAVEYIRKLINYAQSKSLSEIDLCVAYAKSIPWASGIIVGVASLDQLKEIKRSSFAMPDGWAEAIPILPLDILDPRQWSL
jgi:aryl-alcohol dehydrogenase-like predicted oxidoreductase